MKEVYYNKVRKVSWAFVRDHENGYDYILAPIIGPLIPLFDALTLKSRYESLREKVGAYTNQLKQAYDTTGQLIQIELDKLLNSLSK